MKILINNINIIDPFSGTAFESSVLVNSGKIEYIGSEKKDFPDVSFEISGEKRILFPGLIDIHTHLREPGFEHKEDIKSGSLAALNGGFTTITSFPNTNPVLDSIENLNNLKKLISEKAVIEVLPIASMTKGLKGEELVDFKALKKLGVKAFTDDGRGIQNQETMIQILKKAHELDLLLLLHEEDEALLEKGVINKGKKSKELNLPGISPEVEEIMTARDLVLAKKYSARIHFCHVSTSFASKIISVAKENGVRATSEVSPHHLCFSEEIIKSKKDSNKKMNPPLRTSKDQSSLIEALKTGEIEAIATDHAPHSKSEKDKGITEAPFGITGLETAIPLLYTKLALEEKISFYRIIEALTKSPADILNIPYHPIKEGNPLNFVIFNTEKNTKLNDSFFYSKSRNFPLFGEVLKGKVEFVFYKNNFIDLEKDIESQIVN